MAEGVVAKRARERRESRDRLLDAALGAVPGAQDRPGQRAMLHAVDDALSGGEHLLVQAGTGTGKSVAYLVPALAAGQRVVVATATKALQAQLVAKDLPRLVEALRPVLKRTPRFALAKGRANYACLLSVQGSPGPSAVAGPQAEQDALFGEPAPAAPRPSQATKEPESVLGATVLRLRRWAEESDTGDRDDVPFPVSDLAWRQVSVSARDCLGSRCPVREECFSERARETASEADVVVANHALLALDAFTQASVLPEHDAVVLDEAHEFAASATEALTKELTVTELRRAAVASDGLLSDRCTARLSEAQIAAEDLLGRLPAGLYAALPDEAAAVLLGLQGAVGEAALEVGRGEPGEEELEKAKRDRAKQALGAVLEAVDELLAPSTQSAVYASPVTRASATVALRVSPLSVGGALNARLFGERTVIATSATLTLGGSFRATARSFGLRWSAGTALDGPLGPGEPHLPAQEEAQAEEDVVRWRSLDVGSPFDHPRQGQLWVADRLPDPGRQPAAWAAEVDDLLVELVTAAGGRTLGLFSSTAAAARAAESVRSRTDLPVLLQGEDGARALTQRFADDPRSCLFGTRSFWQGVDVPGPSLQLVVIDRIPFAHVDDPLVKARLAAAGEHGFADVTLPPAAVLLAQGAGRLLRSPTDRGVVAVLDPRLATARYGGLLLRTLPPFYRARDKDAVLRSLRAIDGQAALVPA